MTKNRPISQIILSSQQVSVFIRWRLKHVISDIYFAYRDVQVPKQIAYGLCVCHPPVYADISPRIH